MEFKKENVFDKKTAGKVPVGSVGYFADSIEFLEQVVTEEDKSRYGLLKKVNPKNSSSRFSSRESPFNYNYFYKVVGVDPNHIPYDLTDELIDDFKSKSKSDLEIPNIWVKDKATGEKFNITAYSAGFVTVNSRKYSLKQLFEYFTFLDGSPCGKEGTPPEIEDDEDIDI